ncbi:MAG: hypothetical protein CHACPFDD_01320 [Phycisphaerae bacterium]|nr:hypothetical protein [Phycisphaerae bacterium]
MSRHPGPLRRVHLFAIIVVPAMLLTYILLCRSNASSSSDTYDEQSHLLAGYVKLTRGDHRFVPEHPHLGQCWAALPLLAIDARAPRDIATPEEWRESATWHIAYRWLYQHNQPLRLLLPARGMITILAALLLIAIVVAAWRTAGGQRESANSPLGAGAADSRRPVAAIAAATLAALSPAMIAHGSLVTTDMAGALGIFVATAAAARFIARPTFGSAALAGAVGGVASVMKFSFVLVIPGLLAAWLLRRWADHADGPASEKGDPEPASASNRGDPVAAHPRRVAPAALLLTIAAITGVASIWACYGFRFRIVPAADAAGFRPFVPYRDPARGDWEWALAGGGVTARAATLLRAARALPEPMIWGLAYNARVARDRGSYFMGKTVFGGSWLYFPVLLAVKTPLPLLVLLLLALLRRPSRSASPRSSNWRAALARCDPWVLAASGAVASYGLSAVLSGYNLGHRHLLPIEPFMIVAAAGAAARLAHGARGDRVGLAALALWLVIGAGRAHPNELAYFNEICESPERAAYVAVDSNLDWGQDMLKLAALQRAHADEPAWRELKLSYFGMGDPAAYGVSARYLPSANAPPDSSTAALTPGVYAFSASCLRLFVVDLAPLPQANNWTAALNRDYADLLRRMKSGGNETLSPPDIRRLEMLTFMRLTTALRRSPPDALAGRSVFVYEIDQTRLDALLAPD